MKLPMWYKLQLLVWVVTAAPAYVVTALWGPPDWWLVNNIFNSDLSSWEIAFFTAFFFHPLGTLPFVVGGIVRRRNLA